MSSPAESRVHLRLDTRPTPLRPVAEAFLAPTPPPTPRPVITIALDQTRALPANPEADEATQLREDVARRPEFTADAYARVPLAAFGLAMLRGMGFKGDVPPSDAPVFKRRPPGLGLGATPRPPSPPAERASLKRPRTAAHEPMPDAKKSRRAPLLSTQY